MTLAGRVYELSYRVVRASGASASAPRPGRGGLDRTPALFVNSSGICRLPRAGGGGHPEGVLAGGFQSNRHPATGDDVPATGSARCLPRAAGSSVVLARPRDRPIVVCPPPRDGGITDITSRPPSHGGVLGGRLACCVRPDRPRSRLVRCTADACPAAGLSWWDDATSRLGSRRRTPARAAPRRPCSRWRRPARSASSPDSGPRGRPA
jgi:hypothetical protein